MMVRDLPATNTLVTTTIPDSCTFTDKSRSVSDIIKIKWPSEFDVVCSKDKTWSKHPGNEVYRFVLTNALEEYQAVSKHDKMYVTKRIVETMKNSYNTRFVRYNKINQTWEIISDEQARDKTSHALRFAIKNNNNKNTNNTNGNVVLTNDMYTRSTTLPFQTRISSWKSCIRKGKDEDSSSSHKNNDAHCSNQYLFGTQERCRSFASASSTATSSFYSTASSSSTSSVASSGRDDENDNVTPVSEGTLSKSDINDLDSTYRRQQELYRKMKELEVLKSDDINNSTDDDSDYSSDICSSCESPNEPIPYKHNQKLLLAQEQQHEDMKQMQPQQENGGYHNSSSQSTSSCEFPMLNVVTTTTCSSIYQNKVERMVGIDNCIFEPYETTIKNHNHSSTCQSAFEFDQHNVNNVSNTGVSSTGEIVDSTQNDPQLAAPPAICDFIDSDNPALWNDAPTYRFFQYIPSNNKDNNL